MENNAKWEKLKLVGAMSIPRPVLLCQPTRRKENLECDCKDERLILCDWEDVEFSSLEQLMDFVCTLSGIGATMQMYDELLQKYVYLYEVYNYSSRIVVKEDDRLKPHIIQVLSSTSFHLLILEPMGNELLALSKSICVLHQQVRSILAWEDSDVVGMDDPLTDLYSV